MTLFAWADWLMSCEDASIRKFGLRSLFHFPVDISVGVDPVRGGSKWKRRAYCVSAKWLPNQAFPSVSNRSPFLFEAVVQSWEKPVWEWKPKLFGGFSNFGLIFSTKSSQSSCVCVQGYNRTEYSVSVETGSIHTCSWRFPRICSVCTGGGINLASLMVLWGETRRLISVKWFAHKEASVTAGLSLFYVENKPHLKLVFLSKQLTQNQNWFIKMIICANNFPLQ